VLRVGLTGGIASGKTHVARRLAQAGFQCLDLDQVAHAVMARGGSAYADVVEAFGPRVLATDGSIDRKALGGIVFPDPAARELLNRLVHPRIREEEDRIEAGLREEPGAVLVVEAALLVESGIHLRFDRLVVAFCPPEEQTRRLQARDGLDAVSAAARLRAQMPPSEKRRFAHASIDTTGSLAETDARADEVAQALRALATVATRPRALSPGMLSQLTPTPPEPWQAGEEGVGGLDLVRLQERLYPGSGAPWYAPPESPRVSPDAAARFGALQALRRRGDDRDYAAAVAYSLARLTQRDAEAIAHATLIGLALHEAACGHPGGPSPAALDFCRRWADQEPSLGGVEAARTAAAKLRSTG